MNLNEGRVQITPYAILAAILFNLDKTEQVMTKPDDGTEEIEITTKVVGIESEGDALVCVLPAEKVMHFATTVYNCQVKVDGGFLFVTFERRKDGGGLVAANGKPISTDSFAINNLMARLNGGN